MSRWVNVIMEFKRGLLFGMGVLVALSLVLAYMGNAHASDSSVTPSTILVTDKDRTITVTGNGYVYSEPDIAKITIGVTTEAETSTDAMSKNADQMSKVVSAIKKAGIPDKDIQTSRVNVDPVYNYNSNKPKITGYRATNKVTVTIRDTSKVGPVIDAAYNAGANEINGVNFMLSEDKAAGVYQEALKKAIADGSDKAKTIASASGVGTVRLKSISESGSYNPPPPVPLYAARGVAETAAPTPISTGEERVQATVTMVYTFE